ARVFCQEGGRVAILDTDRGNGEALARELTEAGSGRAVFLDCDVTQPQRFQAAVDQTVAESGRLDCMINNVGWHPPAQTIDETGIDDMERLMRLNYLTTFMGCKFALPHLRRTNGTIVNISSMTAILGQEHAAAYCATKAAQVGLTRGLAIELGPQGVRVNAILPSNIDTPLMREWANSLADPVAAIRRKAEVQVFNRLGTPEEIGRVALFLATDDSSFLTGQAIEAEGGSSLDY
ncbi:MAG: SDR family oxidoreductase, partial [Planctomycetaceae bacterium]